MCQDRRSMLYLPRIDGPFVLQFLLLVLVSILLGKGSIFLSVEQKDSFNPYPVCMHSVPQLSPARHFFKFFFLVEEFLNFEKWLAALTLLTCLRHEIC